MYNVFEVTDWGLTVGNKNIAPGSKLLFKGVPPVAWKSVGNSIGQLKESQEIVFGTTSVVTSLNSAIEQMEERLKSSSLEVVALKKYIKEMREYYESKPDQTFEVASPNESIGPELVESMKDAVESKYHEVSDSGEGAEAEDIADLRNKYEEVLGKKPHHMMKAETLKQKIEEAE